MMFHKVAIFDDESLPMMDFIILERDFELSRTDRKAQLLINCCLSPLCKYAYEYLFASSYLRLAYPLNKYKRIW